MFEKSILIASHPDDEILFFSSVLGRVNEIVLCFLRCKSVPVWGAGREKSLTELPIKNVSCIGLDESDTFYGVDWKKPIITEYGLAISDTRISDRAYKDNYKQLKDHLRLRLTGFKNVFTHNPWGEYGHNEHVQIYRVIKELQKEMRYTVWYSNYCSNKSFGLMLTYVSGFTSDYVTLKTDKHLADQIMTIYKKNNCWTWYDDWVWFNEESFIRDRDVTDNMKEYGHLFPLNMIKVEMKYLSMPKDVAGNKTFSFRQLVSQMIQRVERGS